MSSPSDHVLITGGATRIGRAIALALAKEGWQVTIQFRSSDADAEALVREITSEHKRAAAAIRCDLSDETQVSNLITHVTAQNDPLNCLINNASAFENDDIDTMTRDSWDLHMETNLRAPLLLSQKFAAQLPEGVTGNIVNIIDQRVWKLTPQFLTYTLSKAGLWTLTQTLAQALGPRIRVNGIGPGPTLKNKRQSEEDFQKQIDATPLQRGATAEEIAAGIKFILSAPALTGQMIALDGGQHLIWQTPDVVGLKE